MSRLLSRMNEKIRFEMYRISQGQLQSLDIARLKGFSTDTYRLRIGKLRVIYCVDNGEMTILVIKVGPRGDVYK